MIQRVIFQKIDTIYNLISEKEINSAQNLIKKIKLLALICSCSLDDTILKSEKLIRYNELLKLAVNGEVGKDNILELEELILENRQECYTLHFDFFERKKEQITLFVNYQLLLKNAYKAYENHNYDSCVSNILAVKKIALYNRFIIDTIDMYKIFSSFDIDCNLIAIKKLIEIDSLDLAMRLLQHIVCQNVPIKETKQLQKNLGFRLAVRDFSLKPYKTLYQSISEYFGLSIIRYRFFFYSYFNQRRKMKYFKL